MGWALRRGQAAWLQSADVLRVREPLSLLALRDEEGEPGRVYYSTSKPSDLHLHSQFDVDAT